MADPQSPKLDLLVLADLHYVGKADHVCAIPSRHARLGKELAERAVRRALRQGRPDAVVLLGDLVDQGLAGRADEDLAAVAKALAQFQIPILAVPGNHDGPAERLFGIFGDRAGVHELGGYQVITLAAAYDEFDRARYAEADLALVVRAAAAAPDKPIVVLQHNPVYPPIPDAYPYNPTNADEIVQCYERAGVVASLSGHYHAGIAPMGMPAEARTTNFGEGVWYVTAPALCEEPFRFLRVRLRGRALEVDEHALRMDAETGTGVCFRSVQGESGQCAAKARGGERLLSPFPLWDVHCHTQFADCRDDVEARGALERARLLGLRGLVFAEHSTQLYVGRDDFWGARFFGDPGLLRRNRHTPVCRMDAYLAQILPLRSDSVLVGLEVDSDGCGGITLLDEDRRYFDLLIGAVHWVPCFDPAAASDAERARRFMAATESVVRAGVDVLAHPFRYFRRNRLERPTELYRPLAQLLAAAGVAAEINFHTNEPDPAFFALCLEEGVKIALGTDAHALWEVGELWPHLDVLRQAGCSEAELPRVLYRPGAPG